MIQKFRNINYGSSRADLCKCNACGEKNFLVPYNADICPFCGEEGCMSDLIQDVEMDEVAVEIVDANFTELDSELNKKLTMKHYWKIDLIGNECDGSSFCVVTNTNENETTIVQNCLDANLIDSSDMDYYTINAEEITDDDYEMGFWKKCAVNI